MNVKDLDYAEKNDLLNEMFQYFKFRDFNEFFELIDETAAFDAVLEELYRVKQISERLSERHRYNQFERNMALAALADRCK